MLVKMMVRMRVAIPAKDAIVMSGQARFYDPAAFHRAMVRGMGGRQFSRMTRIRKERQDRKF